MLGCKKIFCIAMEEQIPSSTPPQFQALSAPSPDQLPLPSTITPEVLEALKARAREEAVRMTLTQNQNLTQEPPQESREYPNPQQRVQTSFQVPLQNNSQIVYVRRNMTLAELIVVFVISCGLVFGAQAAWNFSANVLPRLEIKVK
jgi:hypothetical protein